MARRRKDDDNSIGGIISGIVVFYLIWLVTLYFSNRSVFWRQFWYFVIFLGLFLLGAFAWGKFRHHNREKRINNILNAIKQNGLEDYIKNFINRFGSEKKKNNVWTYRGHVFDWDRLKDFRKFLNEKGMHLSFDKWGDTSLLLRYYIQQKEERLTRESVGLNPKKFNDLSGTDFENLLFRLFEAMGYAVQKKGRVGDQGGDLIANLSGQRIIIQAKRYTGTVGNDAIQEAVAAQKFYDCNKTIVATNSVFSREAIELARANNVEFIGGEKLSELLLQYLKESWV